MSIPRIRRCERHTPVFDMGLRVGPTTSAACGKCRVDRRSWMTPEDNRRVIAQMEAAMSILRNR